MQIRYYVGDEVPAIWMMHTPHDNVALPAIGEEVIVQGKQYRLIFRRWYLQEFIQPQLGQPYRPAEVCVDMKLEELVTVTNSSQEDE